MTRIGAVISRRVELLRYKDAATGLALLSDPREAKGGDEDQVGKDPQVLNEQIKDAGSWISAGGLHPSSSATVVRQQAGDTLITKCPYLEAKGTRCRRLNHHCGRSGGRSRVGCQSNPSRHVTRRPGDRARPFESVADISPHAITVLTRVFGSIGIAEDAVQEAFTARHAQAVRAAWSVKRRHQSPRRILLANQPKID